MLDQEAQKTQNRLVGATLGVSGGLLANDWIVALAVGGAATAATGCVAARSERWGPLPTLALAWGLCTLAGTSAKAIWPNTEHAVMIGALLLLCVPGVIIGGAI